MRYVSYTGASGPSWGVEVDGGIADLRHRAPSIEAALAGGSLPSEAGGPVVATDAVELLPPIPDARRIFCIGLNYVDHVEEMAHAKVDHPTVFVRFGASVVAHGQPIVCPDASDHLDYEGELAVVIGRRGRSIPQDRALEHVAGYSCFNDGSVRDWQRHTTQFTPGKNFDRSGAFGPALVTPDEVGDIAALTLQTRRNGEVVQQTSTGLMTFPVPRLIEYISSFTELGPGDVIATGTPSGVAAGQKPPNWLRPGDVVDVEISRVGTLTNVVRAHDA